ncbi:MAG: flagellar biosynthetic protein FliO [Planctomycetales bacterium]|nr:flagellar biosynthetic protein FliO [Planctomycetales bacterium]
MPTCFVIVWSIIAQADAAPPPLLAVPDGSAYAAPAWRESAPLDAPLANAPQGIAPASAAAPLPNAVPAATNAQATPALRLSPPSAAGERQLSLSSGVSPGRSLVTVGSSLAIVLGLFFAMVWLMRKNAPAGAAALSSDVVQVLGRAPLAARQQMQLVRVGEKLLLVAVTTSGATTLTEITDPEEVRRLAAACEAARPTSATGAFRQVLAQLGHEPSMAGFFGQESSTASSASAARERRGGTHA